MFVCQACHPKRCLTMHLTVSYGPCELCRRETKLYDCVASGPLTKEELEAASRAKAASSNAAVQMYRHVRRVEYPRSK